MLQTAGLTTDSSSAKIRMNIQPKIRPQGKKTQRRLNISCLKKANIRQHFVDEVKEKENNVQITDS